MIRRLFHNIVQMHKKDEGAHFTYNLGVSFVRAGSIILCLAALVFGLSLLNIGGHLRFVAEKDVKVMGFHRTSNRSSQFNIFNYLYPEYSYNAYFKFVVGKEEIETGQQITENLFGIIDKAWDESVAPAVMRFKIYESESEGYYLSRYDRPEAEEEFRRLYPPFGLKTAAFWLLVLAIPVILIGVGEERLAMKYPRNDVEIGVTTLALSEDEADDLLKEFEEEYSKHHRNWVKDPPRPDELGDIYRLTSGKDGGPHN